jgi:hypothetical protein
MTECNQTRFVFEAHFSRQVVAEFSGERISSEGGALLLRSADRKMRLLQRVVACFCDGRDPQRVEHELAELLGQRIYGLALGYEDLNDHEQLRHDPLLVEIFLEAHPRAPRRIVLDLDVTDIPLHGEQESRFFHGYYNQYCYLPLYIFCGEHLLCARLRPSNQDASAGSLTEVERIVQQIRRRWPRVQIVLRADSGFCREELMGWCEKHRVDYVFGLARNQRLRHAIGKQMHQAQQEHQRTGQAARGFADFSYRTRKSWSRSRRVVGKAEYLEKGENPRFVVTSLPAKAWPAQKLYEQLYCARGEMENRIKEQLSLFSDRLSTETMRANQLRLYFSSLAYVLVHALRRLALRGTEWAQAQVGTLRLRLLKIAAQVRITARRIWIRYSSAYPWQALFLSAWKALRC